jgi:peptidoglycan/xylan/chitin deacetylase (PgdA/CDA1 family)
MTAPRILCYHAVSSTWHASLSVLPSALERQAAALRRRGFVGLTVTESERLRAEGRLPERTVVFTFDDAYSSTLLALPILETYGFPATVFVPTGFVDAAEPLEWAGTRRWAGTTFEGELAPATWDMLRMFVHAGWEAGSHSVTHPLLTGLDDGALAFELEASRDTLIRELGSCTSIAYPYGGADERVAAAAATAGYTAGVVLARSRLPDRPLTRHRMGIYHKDTGWRARAKLSATLNQLHRMAAASGALPRS